MKRIFALPVLLAGAIALAACAPAPAAPAPAEAAPTEAMATEAAPTEAMATEAAPAEGEMATMDIVDTAVSAGSFGTLVAAVQAAGLVDALKAEGPFTVFAPSDEAFAKLPQETLDALLADPTGDLTQILLLHVVPAKVLAADVSDGLSAETLQGGSLNFTVADGKVSVNGANVVGTDVMASNGVIHVIDSVILPAAEGEAAPAEEEAMEAEKDIVDTAVAAGSFGTLVAAVEAAGLVDALKAEGPFTVFAPSDEAFAKLPAGTVEGLLADPEALSKVLLYHVISGKVMAADVTDGLAAETLQGSPVNFSVADGKVMINDAVVSATDVEASNGVIHVIDSVILPPQE
jgi:uncharacterized surface protein with fasciclin (FAS1) repeats